MAANTYSNNTIIRICSWNCRSIRNKSAEFYNFMVNQNVDVALLQETHLNPNEKLSFLNYTTYRTDRLTHRGGGTAIVIKNNINHKPIHIPTGHPGMEMTAIAIIHGRNDRTILISCYNPPLNHIDAVHFPQIFHSNHPTILGGDLNAKNVIWHSKHNNQNGTQLESIANSSNIHVDAPNSFTYDPSGHPNKRDVLDVFCLKNSYKYYTLSTMYALNSDHIPVVMQLYNFHICHLSTSLKRTDWNKFNNILSNDRFCDTHILLSKTSIDNEIQTITDNITSALDSSTAIQENLHNPYILPRHIRELIRERNRARKTYQWELTSVTKDLYYSLRKEVQDAIKDFRQSQWDTLIEGLSSSGGSLWKMVRQLKRKSHNIPAIQHNGNKIVDDQDKVEIFAHNYEQQFTINLPPTHHHNRIKRRMTEHIIAERTDNPICMDAPKFTKTQINHIIKNLQIKKAPGHDNITNNAIKSLPPNYILKLQRIYNSCARLGYFPQLWKTAMIKPIHKPGKSTTSTDSYRPISLLPNLGKIFEKLLQAHIENHLSRQKVIQQEQFGFQKKHSTIQQLSRIVEMAHSGFTVGAKTMIVFLDIEKAFDRIWKEGLILKCLNYDFPVWLLLMIHSFLTNRKYRVKINNSISEIHPINAGVPQGSVIGPTLFCIYMSDLRIQHPAEMALFADDTAIFTRDIKPSRGFVRLQNALDYTGRWFKQWRLKINESKTEAMIIHRDYSMKYPDNLKLNGTPINWVKTYTYLGVKLDQKLTFADHIRDKVKQARIAKFNLWPILNKKSKLTVHNKILLWKQIFIPALLYASTVWNTAPDTAFKLLNSFQRMFFKTCLGYPSFVDGDMLLHNLGIPTIEEQVYNLALNYYESIEEHPNQLVQNSVKYDIKQIRKRKRPRDYLLKKPP